ncbi:MAG TPA: S46 family peptidase, partial [Gammaproteobacteria bacterium]|nr:S46 family peptidase [Gammaproteobacteria bacterium]
MRSRSTIALFPVFLLAAGAASADEGMWTFDNFPRELVRERFGVTIDDGWLDNVRLATVRLSGCTGSFVSPNGLILTNHHCVVSCLAQRSTRERSLIDLGFVANGREGEIDCPTQIADVLERLENVTEKVQAATRGLDERDANERRRQTLTELEQACETTSRNSGNPLKCEAVTLYNGGQYWLYQYHRYDDVRLVFAPEDDIAAFGGDPDNFQFPRWDLDFSLLRAYENGAPAATPRHLTINFAGPAAGDPVFVPGHPGSTDRQLTVAELEALRSRVLPPALLRASELRGRYIQFAKNGDEQRRLVQDVLFSLENSIKVQRKQLDALLEDALLAAKRDEQANLRARVNRNRALAAEVGDPWKKIEDALAVEAARFLPYQFIEGGTGFNSRLWRYARSLVRAAAERPKPNGERLREYTDSFLPRLEQQLAAPVPIYPEVEQLTLSFSLERMREWLGPDAPVVRRLLATDSPDDVAARLVTGSTLADPAVRMQLWNGGQAAIDASTDPFIVLARSLDAEARELRKWHEDEVEAVVEAAHEQIARARFQIFGTSVYPDATFTLRLNFGTVQGWIENGTPVEPFTYLDRLFERATGQPPFRIPLSWLAARAALDPRTPFNLSTNNDIVGGNSGSPLVAADGRIVGLL